VAVVTATDLDMWHKRDYTIDVGRDTRTEILGVCPIFVILLIGKPSLTFENIPAPELTIPAICCQKLKQAVPSIGLVTGSGCILHYGMLMRSE
jgi:hypothetical protein